MKRFYRINIIIVFFLLVFFSISFAGGLKLTPYEDEENGFSIFYPKDWDVEKVEGFAFFAMGKNELNIGIIKRINFGREEVTLSKFAATELDDLKTLDDFEEISVKENIVINGYDAVLRIYTYKVKFRKFKSLEYYIQGKNSGFVVVFDGPNGLFDQLEEVAKKCIDTFKLIGDEALIIEEKRTDISPIVGRDIQSMSEWENFIDQKKRFAISYPSNWKIVSPYEDVVFEVNSSEGYQVQILNHNLGKSASSRSYFQSTGRWLKKHLDKYEELEVREIPNGFERIYQFSDKNGIVKKVDELYFVKKGEDGITWGYTLVFVAPMDMYDDVAFYFEKIKESFTLDPERITSKPEEPLQKTPPTSSETPGALQLPEEKDNLEGVNEDNFVLYRSPQGSFEIMIPKDFQPFEEDEEVVIYGDIDKGYIVGVGMNLFDIKGKEKIDIDLIKKKFDNIKEELGVEDSEIVEGPREYKDGYFALLEVPESPYPGMKEMPYYVVIFAKPKDDAVLALSMILPKSDYKTYKSKIDFMIDSLK